MSDRLTSTYAETCNLIRHYDNMKYTCWTVYTAIVAGLYFAKSSKEIGGIGFLIGVGLASLYFCFLLTRVQRNYKIYCSIAEKIEHVFRNDELAIRSNLPADFKIGPFDLANETLPGHFDRITRLERFFGSVPYFTLHIVFFVSVFLLTFAVHLINSVPAHDAPPSLQRAVREDACCRNAISGSASNSQAAQTIVR